MGFFLGEAGFVLLEMSQFEMVIPPSSTGNTKWSKLVSTGSKSLDEFARCEALAIQIEPGGDV